MGMIDKILIESIPYKPQQRFSELKPFLQFMVKRNCKIVLEIGAATGGLTYIFSKLFEKVIAIDIHHEAQFNSPNILRLQINPHDPTNTIERLRGHRFDLIFIDGDHSYTGVKMDLNLYENFLSEAGVLALHDIKETEIQKQNGCFVSDVIKEGDILRRYKNTVIFNEFTNEWGGEYDPNMLNHGGIQIFYN
jgi:predicted O-methyltransferase YrrM